jgi:RNA polymerase sigma factor (sigma-70 family)
MSAPGSRRTNTQPLRVAPIATTSPDGLALQRAAAGDVGAIGEVYERHVRTLLRFAVRVVGAADADDIVQSTFVRAAKVSATYDDRAGSARRWLLGIAARLVQERRRSLARWTRALARFGIERGQTVTLPDEHTDLEKGLARLSEAKRSVLVLAEIEGFGCEEIARILDIPIGTVWGRLHHARRELRKYYEEGS